jgi:AcrR family transcriptional regulator
VEEVVEEEADVTEAGVEGLRERKRAHSRATTVDVAMQLFAERGYDAVPVADICAAAEIAPRTFFRYFPTKEDVLAEPARLMAARLSAAISAAPAELDDAAVLLRALRELGEYVVTQGPRLALFFRVAASSQLRANPFLHLSGRERGIAEELVRRRSGAGPADWRTRLLVARSVAAFRIWLDDVATGDQPDPLQHLAEVLEAS